MKLVDDIDSKAKETEIKNAAPDTTEKLFFAMLNGQTISETVQTSRGEFTVKFPKQKDIITIGSMAAFMRSGIPSANFDNQANYEIQKCAELDVMVSSGPEWFEAAKKKDKNFSWRSVPDAHFVDEVYAKAWEFRQSVQKRLREDQETVAEKTGAENAAGVPADVGDGVFQGASGSSKRDRP